MDFITCLTNIRKSGDCGRGRGEKELICMANILADGDDLKIED